MRTTSAIRGFKGLWISLAVFLLLIFSALALFNQVGRRADAEQTAVLREAVRRAAVSCYAIEGRYPASVAYLREFYGLNYDLEKYIVRLDAFASNVMPDITVLVKGAGAP